MSNQSAGDVPGRQGEYIVVARRYRPQTFEQLVGQDLAARALTNAIETNRVGHAYLFTGARGVGKTSTARIFSKSLNCEHGPTAQPCDQCDTCQSITSGEDVDVIEIDGASNRGIDEIRQLRSNVNVRPSRSRFKIYIIDEVHMLTTDAFNALLKTLEEPPGHVKFIFCTTDPEKIPITVLSRCQRFDFAPVARDAIVGRLTEIVAAEDATAEVEALELLARRAAGSMRDSQSLLEQLLAFGGRNITVDGVHALLGTADVGVVSDISQALLDREAAKALGRVDQSLQDGVDVGQLAEQLLGYIRDVMTATVGADPELLRHAGADDFPRLQASGKKWGMATILASIQILDQTLSRMRYAVDRRTLFETALVRICCLEDLQDIANLIAGDAARPPVQTGAGSRAANTRRASLPTPSKKKTTGDSSAGLTTDQKPSAESSCPPAANARTTLPKMEITADNADAVWRTVADQVTGLDAEAARSCKTVEFNGSDQLVVTFTKSFHADRCRREPRQQQLEDLLCGITGKRIHIDYRVAAANGTTKSPRKKSSNAMIREAMNHPLVQEAMELFDAEVTRVAEPKKQS